MYRLKPQLVKEINCLNCLDLPRVLINQIQFLTRSSVKERKDELDLTYA